MNHTVKEFARYTSLSILAMLSVSLFILADTFFIALMLGPYGLAALNFSIPVFGFMLAIGLMLGIGGATKYSIYIGQGLLTEANQIYTTTVALMLVCIAIFFTGGLLFADEIAWLLGARGYVFYMARDYLSVILLFSPAFMVNFVIISFVRNDGAPQLATACMVSNSFSNIALDYIMVVILEMGMFGAALATGLSNIVSILILSTYFIRKKNSFSLQKLKLDIKILFTDIQGILGIGVPSFISEVSVSGVIIVFNLIILRLEGNIGVAAYGVIANTLFIVVAIYGGISQGIQPLISKYYGEGIDIAAKNVLRYALVLTAALSVIIYLVVFFFAYQITGIFNREQNPILETLAVIGIRIYFTGTILAGFNIIISTYFTSTDNPRPAQIISILRGFVVIMPMVFMLSYIWGMVGVWLAFPFTELLVCGISFFILKWPNK